MAILINSHNGGWQVWEGLDSWFHSHLDMRPLQLSNWQVFEVTFISLFICYLFCLCMCVCVCVYICMSLSVCTCLNICVCIHVYIWACVCARLHVCMCAHMCVHVLMPYHEFGGQKQPASHYAGLVIELRSSDLMPISFTGWLHAHDCNSESA